MKMSVFMLFVFVGVLVCLGSIVSCNDPSGSSGDGGGVPDPYTTDIYEGLRDVTIGEIKCSGDHCCIKDCWGDQDMVCMTRWPEYIMAHTQNAPTECTGLQFPEWFYAYDCFVITEGIRGDTGEPMSGTILRYDSSGDYFIMWLRCFCGRTASSYSSAVSQNLAMAYFPATCKVEYDNPPSYELSSGSISALEGCANPCKPCTEDCAGRECGPDGCGGSCGTCGTGTCNAAGQCVSNNQDLCSNCLAACRGLPGCCTGCGCICESVCGGCF